MFTSTKGPARPTPSGRIIQRELDERGWTQNDLAAVMDRPAQAISEIVTGKKQITAETALELGEAFGVDAAFWSNLQSTYNLHQARQQRTKHEVARRSQLYSVTPLADLIKRRWVDVTRKSPIERQEQAVCRFLGISDLGASPELAISFRSSAHRGPDWTSKVAWAKRIEQIATPMAEELPPFRKASLKKRLPELLALSATVEGVKEVPDFLARLGIGFVILRHLPKTYLDGAVLPVAGHPVLAVSLRYDRIDNFWFTLLHEVSHCLEGHHVFIEQNGEDEDSADAQAADWLLPETELKRFLAEARPRPTLSMIERLAARLGRHPGIIIGQMQKRVPGFGYAKGRQHLVKIGEYLEENAYN